MTSASGGTAQPRPVTVVIAGCGDLGTEAGLRFAATGCRVLGLRRSPRLLPGEILGAEVDLTRQVPNLPADTEILVIALAPERATKAAYRSVYVDAVSNTLAAVTEAGAFPRRILLVSSTAAYGTGDGGWVDETTPAQPSTMRGMVIREGELALHQRYPQAVVLRLAGLYGPGRSRLIDQVRTGAAVAPPVSWPTNRIHRDDAAAAIVHLTTMSAEPEPLYLGVDDQPVERGEVLRFLADELGVPHPRVSHDEPARGGDKRYRNNRLRATGFRFAYPSYREGYRSVLAGHGRRHR